MNARQRPSSSTSTTFAMSCMAISISRRSRPLRRALLLADPCLRHRQKPARRRRPASWHDALRRRGSRSFAPVDALYPQALAEDTHLFRGDGHCARSSISAPISGAAAYRRARARAWPRVRPARHRWRYCKALSEFENSRTGVSTTSEVSGGSSNLMASISAMRAFVAPPRLTRSPSRRQPVGDAVFSTSSISNRRHHAGCSIFDRPGVPEHFLRRL
jgi:hypothetical protein